MAGTFKVTPREPPALYTTHSPISTPHTGARATHAARSLLSDSFLSFLPEFLVLYLPRLRSASASLLAGGDGLPDRG